MKIIYPRFGIAVAFIISQNMYFGWHMPAASDAELIADGISMLLLSLCFPGEK